MSKLFSKAAKLLPEEGGRQRDYHRRKGREEVLVVQPDFAFIKSQWGGTR
jgi:hypothetical protein